MLLRLLGRVFRCHLAANGVDLREPLKPFEPDDDQEIVLPCASVIVIMVLLKLALTCATPDVMFFFSRRRMRTFCCSLAISCSRTRAWLVTP